MRAALVGLALLACNKTPPEEPAPPTRPPTTSPGDPDVGAIDPGLPLDAPFQYRGWPGEGVPVITATRATSLPLLDRPAGTRVASCDLASGGELSYTASLVRSDRPAPVRLAAPMQLPQGSVSYGPVDVLDPATAHSTPAAGRTLGPDDQIAHLQFRAEGVCHYRVDNADVVETPCFHDASSSAVTSWWVQTSCAGRNGWVRVDDASDLDVARRF